VLLRAESERVNVNAGVGGAGVGEERLDKVEVGSLALREAVLAVELELGRDDWVLTPAVELESSLREYEGAGIRNVRLLALAGSRSKVRGGVVPAATSGITIITASIVVPEVVVSVVGCINQRITSTCQLEETILVNERFAVWAACSNGAGPTEGMDGVGKSINGIGVVEWLSTKSLVEELVAGERAAVVNVGVRLYNPDELLDGVVEVELNLVGGRTNRLIASELELLNEVLVRILGHAPALIRVKEDVVDVKGCSNKRLVVGSSYLGRTV